MSSKRWTIVCLTLMQLIFGCSDAALTKVDEPIVSEVVEMPTVFTRQTAAELLPQSDFGNRQLPPLPGFGGIVGPQDASSSARLGLHPCFPPELPGVELPGFESVPGTELLRLQQPDIPLPTTAHEVRSMISS